MLSKGINFVPQDKINCKKVQKRIEQDLITAAINFYRDENKVYPMVDAGLGLKTVVEQLISQTPSNTKQLEFYSVMFDEYISHKTNFYDQMNSEHFMDAKTAQKIIPSGSILTVSDKGLGPCLVPIEWYIQQYRVQSEKGNHLLTNMSNDQCISFLKAAIQTFRSTLCLEERTLLQTYHSKSNPNYRVGVLKLVPKIHKLSKFDSQSWYYILTVSKY